MKPSETDAPGVEPDSRFPSGPWTGFFLEPKIPPGRHGMELILTFRDGKIQGEGRDRIGNFLISGKYQVEDGRCWWIKTYIKQHSINYTGYNEGKGIWGIWEYSRTHKGGFHIWPVAMGDPTQSHLAEAIDEPAPAPPIVEPIEAPATPAEVAAPVGSADERGDF